MSDTASIRSNGSEFSVCTQTGFLGKVSHIKPGSITQSGLFGTVRRYKEGSCIYGGFFGTTKFVTAGGTPSPYVTPTSSPNPSPMSNDTKPEQSPPDMTL